MSLAKGAERRSTRENACELGPKIAAAKAVAKECGLLAPSEAVCKLSIASLCAKIAELDLTWQDGAADGKNELIVYGNGAKNCTKLLPELYGLISDGALAHFMPATNIKIILCFEQILQLAQLGLTVALAPGTPMMRGYLRGSEDGSDRCVWAGETFAGVRGADEAFPDLGLAVGTACLFDAWTFAESLIEALKFKTGALQIQVDKGYGLWWSDEAIDFARRMKAESVAAYICLFKAHVMIPLKAELLADFPLKKKVNKRTHICPVVGCTHLHRTSPRIMHEVAAHIQRDHAHLPGVEPLAI